jgi:DNA-binding NtrC family response regulator
MVTAALGPLAPARADHGEAGDPIAALAGRGCAVLVAGEIGTGKERCARALHRLSGCTGPFVAVHCSAIPAPLVAAALFGDGGGPGLVASAAGGTLFLDEVADLPGPVQVPLAIALDRAHDVRAIAATRHDLEPLIRDSRFHHDLYRVLAAARLTLPPLRERRGDIPALVDELLAGCARLSPAALSLLIAYPWPGNLRQLTDVVHAASAASRGVVIEPEHLPAYVRAGVAPRPTAPPPTAARLGFAEAQARFEAGYFGQLLAEHGGNLSRVARASGLSRATVRTRARALGLLPDPRGRR